jgi:hypothetical protein
MSLPTSRKVASNEHDHDGGPDRGTRSVPDELDQEWAHVTLAGILADHPSRQPHRRNRRWLAAIGIAGVITLSTGTAVAAAGLGSIGAVKDALLSFAAEPNTVPATRREPRRLAHADFPRPGRPRTRHKDGGRTRRLTVSDGTTSGEATNT